MLSFSHLRQPLFGLAVWIISERYLRVVCVRLLRSPPDSGVQALPAGGVFGLKSEPRHRGIRFGIARNTVDNWVQALPAGGA